jgi:hypothetical protein
MSFSSGFFNALNHDRLYNATDMGQLFDGLISDGVYEKIGDCFIVKAYSGNIVQIGTGRAWFNNTWSYNDAIMLAEDEGSDQLLPRIDALVLEVNQSNDVRENSIKFVIGTAASSPAKPTLTDSGLVHQYPLAYITRAANSTEITQSDIENTVGTSACPFVAGIVDQNLVIDDLLLQWTDQYEKYLLSKENDFDIWTNNYKEDFQEWSSTSRSEFDNWEANRKIAYEEWFNDLKVTLDDDVATNLKNQINDLSDDLDIVMKLFTIDDVSGAKADAGYKQVSLYWSDPSDTVLDDTALVTWAGTLVVRKEGSAPEDKTDGTVVANNKVRNQYSETPFTDYDLENDVLYYYRFFPYTTEERYLSGTSVSATPQEVVISTTPSVSGTYSYNGSNQSPSWNDYNTSELTIGGDYIAKDAGTYTVTFTPREGYTWSDGTSDARSVSWTINKIAGTLTLSATSASLTSSNKNASITASNYVGTLSVSSSNSSVAIGTVVSSTIVVSSPNNTNGSATLTVTVAESTNYYSTSKTISVTCKFVELVSWSTGTDEQITAMINAYYNGTFSLSQIKSVWSVGDTRIISLSTMAGLTSSNVNYPAQSQKMVIIDFDHDDLTTPINGKTKALITLNQLHVLSNGTTGMKGAINSHSTNVGGWESCERRKWCNDVYKNATPTYINELIKPVNKLTSAGSTSTTNITTSDSCFFPAEFEVIGSKNAAASVEGTQYSYYASYINRIKKAGNATSEGSEVSWWERSPAVANTSDWCYVYSVGTSGSYRDPASASYGIAPVFCL